MIKSIKLPADIHGEVRYGMTNDYMFRAVLQSNNKVLRGLVCSLLHLEEDEIVSVAVTNPIVLGDDIKDKEFRLDVNVLLNDSTLINLEMQVANRLNWCERSVAYLCRSFDNLEHGQDYSVAKPVIHIGFLDYTLFPEHPKFYDTYKLLSIHDHEKYSDSLSLGVVDLSRIELATEEDRRYHIDSWARLFKAAIWEEIQMSASINEYLQEAANTLYALNADEEVRKRCRDRLEYYQDLKNYERKIERDRLEHEQDLKNYERKIERDRLEHERDLKNYECKIEQDRIKHEQDIQSYKQQIEQGRIEYEQDIHTYKQKIEQVIAENAEKDATIQQLRAEIDALRKQPQQIAQK